jgi:hypothetical protein
MGKICVYTPPLLWTELTQVLNSQLQSLASSGNLEGSYSLSANEKTGQAELKSGSEDMVVVNGKTYTRKTTLKITSNNEDALWWLGFPPSLQIESGQTVRVMPRSASIVDLGERRVSSVRDLVDILNDSFENFTLGEESQFGIRVGLNEETTVILPRGTYSTKQIVRHLQNYVAADFNPVTGFLKLSVDPSSGPLSLDFRSSPQSASLLGFQQKLYEGFCEYESEFSCATGLLLDSQRRVIAEPSCCLKWSASPLDDKLRVTAAPHMGSWELNGVIVDGDQVTASCFSDFSETNAVSPFLQAGEILYINQDGKKRVFACREDSENPLKVKVDPGVCVSDWTDYQQFPATVVRASRNAATLHTNLWGRHARGPDTTSHVSQYASARSVIGFSPVVHSLRSFGGIGSSLLSSPSIIASSAVNLNPPEYLFMVVDYPSTHNHGFTFQPLENVVEDFVETNPRHADQHSQLVLAKFLVSKTGYSRITDESLGLQFSSPLTLETMKIRLVNPDGTLADFRGRDHSFTLIVNSR